MNSYVSSLENISSARKTNIKLSSSSIKGLNYFEKFIFKWNCITNNISFIDAKELGRIITRVVC